MAGLEGLVEAFQANWLPVTIAVVAVIVAVALLARQRPQAPFLDPQAFKPARLAHVDQLTHNTKRFVFELPTRSTRLGLPTGQHITFLGKDADGKDVYRPYTPTTDDDTVGTVEFVIKIYPTGKMSQILDAMKPGDQMLMKGPRGRFTYTRNMKRAIGMIAGGTGVTPMYQVAVAILKDPKDTTALSLIFANVSEDDILIRQQLDGLVQAYPGRFKVYYVLNRAPQGWAGGVGFVTAEMVQQHLPAPADDVLVLRCGPGPMNDAMAGHLTSLGYSPDSLFMF